MSAINLLLFIYKAFFKNSVTDMQFEENISDHNSSLEEVQEDPLVHSITINPESFSDSLKLLQAHGITLQNENDDTNILNTVMESGHSVVLTGKEQI